MLHLVHPLGLAIDIGDHFPGAPNRRLDDDGDADLGAVDPTCGDKAAEGAGAAQVSGKTIEGEVKKETTQKS